MTLGQYFYCRLYDPAVHAELERCVGECRPMLSATTYGWFDVISDKAPFCGRAGRRSASAAYVYAPRQAAIRLRDAPDAGIARTVPPRLSACPISPKPLEGMYSLSALGLAGLQGEPVRLITEEWVPSPRSSISSPGSAEEASCCRTVAAIRFLVLRSPEGPVLETAVLKIPSSRKPADWRTGNMLGALDGSGVVRRVVTGTGVELREVSTHPENGASLSGWRCPPRRFPGVRTQSWDVAPRETGPMLLEMNFGGDHNHHQLAHRRGALTDTFVAHLRRCGVRRLARGTTKQPSPAGRIARTGRARAIGSSFGSTLTKES